MLQVIPNPIIGRYIILGGVTAGQGAIITREEALSLNLLTLAMALKNDTHFVLETNYGAWLQLCSISLLTPGLHPQITGSRIRSSTTGVAPPRRCGSRNCIAYRQYAHLLLGAGQCLNDVGPAGTNLPSLFDILSGRPNLNMVRSAILALLPGLIDCSSRGIRTADDLHDAHARGDGPV